MRNCDCFFCEAGKPHPASHSEFHRLSDHLLVTESLDPSDRPYSAQCSGVPTACVDANWNAYRAGYQPVRPTVRVTYVRGLYYVTHVYGLCGKRYTFTEALPPS